MDNKQFTKLPKWAQAEFQNLQHQRDNAVEALNRYIDTQTASEIFIDHMESIGEAGVSFKRQYVQGHNIEFYHAGIGLRVSVFREGQIELNWGHGDSHGGEVAFIPTSYQAARLVAKENMR